MNRTIITAFLTIISVLFSGYAHSWVVHPENTDIVGYAVYGNLACFVNVGSKVLCDGSAVDEGLLYLWESEWRGFAPSGINGCGLTAVNPVSAAICTYTEGSFAFCVNSRYVLVQTTQSGHYWAVKANLDCTTMETPETTSLVPCLSSDSFDPNTGCTRKPADPNPSVLSIKDGYLKPEAIVTPPDEHCDDGAEVGRMVVDGVNDIIYVCTPSGWSEH